MPDLAPLISASRPKEAASLIVVDRAGTEPRLLMGRRHPGHRFMPDVFVFPGGRVDRSDYRAALSNHITDHLRRSLHACSRKDRPNLPEALVSAAFREAEEEAGLTIEAETASQVRFVARAVTPPANLKRFDTRFFMLDRSLIGHEKEQFAGPDMELTELVWVTYQQALELKIHEITKQILLAIRLKLKDRDDTGAIPFYRQVRGVRTRTMLEF